MQTVTLRIFRMLTAVLIVVLGILPAKLPAQDAPGSERAAIEIISVQHRDPLFVKSELQSFLDPRGSIGQVDNKLIIASTSANLNQLKDMIGSIDVPARRLVVSVDFDYGNNRADNTNQQSSQALEGDRISFTDSLSAEPAAAPEMTIAEEIQTRPQLVMTSAIRGDYAETEVEIGNVPGFSGSYSLSLPLGEWYVINPALEPEDFAASTMRIDNAADTTSTIPLQADEPPSDVAPIAVRVDVLP